MGVEHCVRKTLNLILLHFSKWWFFTNPFEKYARRNGVHLPQIEVKQKKILETPPSYQGLNFVLKEHLDPGKLPCPLKINEWKMYFLLK